MLVQVRIQNYALIDNIQIEFASGLNVLTGETGAGKSILIDALRLCFGDRADSIPFKDSNQPCVLEATVDYVAIETRLGKKITQEKFKEFLEDGDDWLVFRREINPSGKSRNTLNGRLVNLSQIREIAVSLVDWHGQYDFQAIFNPATQLEMIDRYAGCAAERETYERTYSGYAELLKSKQDLLDSVQNREAQIDLLRFQAQEIERVKPKPGEDQKLKSEWIRFSHAEKLHEKLSELLELLDEGDESASIKMSRAFKPLIEIEKIDSHFSKQREMLESVQLQLEEWIRFARDYRDSLSFDEQAARDAESRLNALDLLKRKYGGTLDAVCEFYEGVKRKLELLEDSEFSMKEIDKKIEAALQAVRAAGAKLSVLRKNAALQFSKKIGAELEELGMKQAKFFCRVDPVEPHSHGLEKIEFDLAPNVGVAPQPLSRIASGGEASRVMLAIKKVAGDSDQIPTLVFDEIDANIGGRLGSVVGQKLREIAQNHQVLLITHLPQIAAFGGRHLKVVKTVSRGKTQISYESLNSAARVKELAQMMSGQEETSIALKHAKELLEQAEVAV